VRDGNVYRCGPFELDADTRRLFRDSRPVWIPDRQMDVLLALVSHPGQILTKRELTDAAWRDLSVTDNSIVQAVHGLRETLGTQPDGRPYIKTHMRKGYQFIAPVQRGQSPASLVALDAVVAPHLALGDSRAALETLSLDAIRGARPKYAEIVRAVPGNARGYVGMATADVLLFESTRADGAPDVAALQRSHHTALEACHRNPKSGAAWRTLAFVLHRLGHTRDAVAAASTALTLDEDDWLHWLHLSYVTWGSERLHASNRVLALCPDIAQARWFAGTVYVARQTFDPAITHLRAGCAAQDAQHTGSGRFPAVGLHYLLGLVLGACGAWDEAFDEWARELTFEDYGHIYARETCANTWYAIGALRRRQGRLDMAEAGFHEALKRMPDHMLANIGLQALSTSPGVYAICDDAKRVDAAMAKAAVSAVNGQHAQAAQALGEAILRAEPGSAGWLLPVDPLIDVTSHPEAWAQTLGILRNRAL